VQISYCLDASRSKRAPGVAGASGLYRGEWPRGNEPLDAPIVSQGINQARRGSRKRPDPALVGSGLVTTRDLSEARRDSWL
jgi:hypothetical protein